MEQEARKRQRGLVAQGWREGAAQRRHRGGTERRQEEARRNEKGNKKDGRELAGSQPSAPPRQFRL